MAASGAGVNVRTVRCRSAVPEPVGQPPPRFHARCKACWLTAALLLLIGLSFWSLDLQWAAFLSLDAMRSMGRFIGEFFPPDFSAGFRAPGGAGVVGDARDVGHRHVAGGRFSG